MQFEKGEGILIARCNGETLRIEAWGKDSLRVRATRLWKFTKQDWALTEAPGPQEAAVEIHEEDHWVGDGTVDRKQAASITNGRIRAEVNFRGILTFYRDGKKILREYFRDYDGTISKESRCLKITGREWKGITGGSEFGLRVKFEGNDGEKIFGMGQYQQPYLDLKGLDLELAHRNSQASVPFAVSSLGYGLLWNNPGIGRAVFGKNVMSFEAYSTKALDYWVAAGDTPAQIEELYASVTGTVPMMPEYGLGFWQCKLRYQTQEELLEVAREYKRRNLPIDLIVIDYFHWPKQGEWKFDPVYWPDPEAMVQELQEMGIRLMVSIWPTVDRTCENYEEMLEKGYLIRTERGFRVGLDFMGATIHYDATNPEARKYVWNKAKQNYYDKGIKVFWLDEAEPEYSVYDFDNYRYHRGTNLQIGNIYPVDYAKTFYEGMEAEGQKQIVNLLRCA